MERTNLRLISREFEGFEKSFSHQADAFARERPELAVRREFIEIERLYETMIAAEGARKPEYDLFLCVTDWLPEAIAKGLLTPLDDFVQSSPPDEWPDAWAASLRRLQVGPDGNVYGIPYHDGPEVFMYRKDLFESRREQEAFRRSFGYELRPPKTWSEFLDVARHFTRPGEGLWGTCVAAFPDGHNNVYDFLIQLWSRGGEIFDADWRPRFHDEIGVQALEFYVELFTKHKVVSPECLDLDSVACGFHYAAGNAAMMWNWCGFAAVAEVPEFSQIVGKNQCTIIPRGDGPGGQHTSLIVYWVLTIPVGSKHKREAYDFIRFATSPEMDKITSMLGGNGCRLSTWRDREVQEKYPYYAMIEKAHENVKTLPAIPEYPKVNEALSRMVDDALKGRKSVREALAEAAEEVEAIMSDAGYYGAHSHATGRS